MMSAQPNLRSPLSIVRGLGSARDGTGHFIMQRVTALMLIPLTLWFIYSLLNVAVSPDRMKVVHWLASGLNASALILMLLALFYHAKIGLQVIIEDYVHCPCIKIASLLLNSFIMLALATVSVVAVIKLHLHIIP